MRIADAIRQIKLATHDAIDEYSEPHCLDFLNTAIQQANSMLIAGGFYPLVREVTLKDGSYLPHNFMKQCGQYPIRVTNNKVTLLDGRQVRFRYFANPELLTMNDVDLPFNNDAMNQAVVQFAIMLALNENEYDISQDSTLMNMFQQAIASGMGG